jgi:hypothetical protein
MNTVSHSSVTSDNGSRISLAASWSAFADSPDDYSFSHALTLQTIKTNYKSGSGFAWS